MPRAIQIIANRHIYQAANPSKWNSISNNVTCLKEANKTSQQRNITSKSSLPLIQGCMFYSQNANLSVLDLLLQKYQWPFPRLPYIRSYAFTKPAVHPARVSEHWCVSVHRYVCLSFAQVSDWGATLSNISFSKTYSTATNIWGINHPLPRPLCMGLPENLREWLA